MSDLSPIEVYLKVRQIKKPEHPLVSTSSINLKLNRFDMLKFPVFLGFLSIEDIIHVCQILISFFGLRIFLLQNPFELGSQFF